MSFSLFEEKCRKAGLSQAAIDAFKYNYDQLLAGETGLVPESTIDPVDSLPYLDALKGTSTTEANTQEVLAQTAVLKLNGGLGTSMGLEKAKSLLLVKDGKTFLDLIAEQIKYTREKYHSPVKFILMNSFSTSDDTKAFLGDKHSDLLQEPDIELLQNMSPKVDASTLNPAVYAENPELEWCPPGHGDIYPSLLGSGMLDRLIEGGVKYLFVSNSDNLGATLDLDLLEYFAKSGKDFMMEVAERTESDKKGGHLALRKSDGRFMLRESAMCPDEDKAAFEDINRHKFFNTNNLWINLPRLKSVLEANNGIVKLPVIKNKKTVNPRDASSAAVFQLETAMGSAIEVFDEAGAVVVPRSRFAPVKTTNDLFALRSDAYKVTEESTVVLACPVGPTINLDSKHYKLVDQMESLTEAAPSLIEAKSLTVKGPVKFVAETVIKGDVLVNNESKDPVELPAGTYKNSVVALPLKEAGIPAGVEKIPTTAVV